MKYLIIITNGLLGCALLFSLGCKKEPDTVIVKQERGYNCENFTCVAVETGAQYVTLLDCKSDCADKRPGKAEVNISAKSTSYSNPNFTLTASIAYTADDVAIGAFFRSQNAGGSFYYYDTKYFYFSDSDLEPGVYYYQIVLKETNNVRIKTERITVKPNETTKLNVNF